MTCHTVQRTVSVWPHRLIDISISFFWVTGVSPWATSFVARFPFFLVGMRGCKRVHVHFWGSQRGLNFLNTLNRELLPLADSVAVAPDRVILVGAVLVVLAALERVLIASETLDRELLSGTGRSLLVAPPLGSLVFTALVDVPVVPKHVLLLCVPPENLPLHPIWPIRRIIVLVTLDGVAAAISGGAAPLVALAALHLVVASGECEPGGHGIRVRELLRVLLSGHRTGDGGDNEQHADGLHHSLFSWIPM